MPKIELSDAQLKVVAAGLGELPMKVAAPVWFAIQKQLTEQSVAAPKDEPKED